MKLVVVLAAAAVVLSAAAAPARPPARAVDAVAVAREQVAYEAALIDLTAPRLAAPARAAALRVRGVLAAVAPALAAEAVRWRVSAGRAEELWEGRIGNGAPPPGDAVYACSLLEQESNAEALANTPAATLGSELASIELTLLVEGRQLAAQMTALPALAAQVDADQRDGLHALVPLLEPTDRAWAAAA
jgi:hypothetical protein